MRETCEDLAKHYDAEYAAICAGAGVADPVSEQQEDGGPYYGLFWAVIEGHYYDSGRQKVRGKVQSIDSLNRKIGRDENTIEHTER